MDVILHGGSSEFRSGGEDRRHSLAEAVFAGGGAVVVEDFEFVIPDVPQAHGKLLFSTDLLTINKLVNPAPFTVFFTRESPGKAVVWVAYKVVEAYMKKNKEVTLPQLMRERDYQKILRMSKFKP